MEEKEKRGSERKEMWPCFATCTLLHVLNRKCISGIELHLLMHVAYACGLKCSHTFCRILFTIAYKVCTKQLFAQKVTRAHLKVGADDRMLYKIVRGVLPEAAWIVAEQLLRSKSRSMDCSPFFPVRSRKHMQECHEQNSSSCRPAITEIMQKRDRNVRGRGTPAVIRRHFHHFTSHKPCSYTKPASHIARILRLLLHISRPTSADVHRLDITQ